jgi:hypothetical protein
VVTLVQTPVVLNAVSRSQYTTRENRPQVHADKHRRNTQGFRPLLSVLIYVHRRESAAHSSCFVESAAPHDKLKCVGHGAPKSFIDTRN